MSDLNPLLGLSKRYVYSLTDEKGNQRDLSGSAKDIAQKALALAFNGKPKRPVYQCVTEFWERFFNDIGPCHRIRCFKRKENEPVLLVNGVLIDLQRNSDSYRAFTMILGIPCSEEAMKGKQFLARLRAYIFLYGVPLNSGVITYQHRIGNDETFYIYSKPSTVIAIGGKGGIKEIPNGYNDQCIYLAGHEMNNLKSGILTFRYQYAYDLTFGKSDIGKTFEVEIIEKDIHHTLYKKTDLAPVINNVLVKDSGVHYVSLPIELESNKDVEIVFRWIIPEDDRSPAQFVLDAVAFNSDTDGDKICNKNDLCPESIQDETVMIGVCNTGVLNREGTDPTNGCNLSDEVQEYIDFCLEYRHDRFNSCIVRKFHKLAKINVISWSEVKKLMSCAKNYHE